MINISKITDNSITQHKKKIKSMEEFDEWFKNDNKETLKLPYGVSFDVYRSVAEKALLKNKKNLNVIDDNNKNIDEMNESKLIEKMTTFLLPDTNSNGYTGVLIGSSKSGKTTFIFNLLRGIYKHLKKNSWSKCIFINLFSYNSKTESYSKFKKIKNIKDKLYFNMFDNVKNLDTIIDIEKSTYKDIEQEKKKPYFLNIYDDIVTEKNNKIIMESITILRNKNISTILSLQDPVLLSKTNRGNINMVLTCKLNNPELIESTYKYFLNAAPLEFKNKNEKIKWYKDTINNYKKIYYSPLDNEVFLINNN